MPLIRTLPFGLGILILIIDQWTKYSIRSNFYYGESRSIIDGFFNLVYITNDGAAWNILSGQQLILILISFLVLVFLLTKARSMLMSTSFSRVIYGLLLGGITGNLLDRIRFGEVTDFLDFQFGSYHYPSFNIADASICIAAVLYIFLEWRMSKMKVNIDE